MQGEEKGCGENLRSGAPSCKVKDMADNLEGKKQENESLDVCISLLVKLKPKDRPSEGQVLPLCQELRLSTRMVLD